MSKARTYAFRIGPRRWLLLWLSTGLILVGVFFLGFAMGARSVEGPPPAPASVPAPESPDPGPPSPGAAPSDTTDGPST